MASPLVPSDLHSAVHPPVNAFGNHAITTARPSSSLSRYVRPSEPGSVKSGARSPGFSSTVDSMRRVLTFTTPTMVAATVVNTVLSRDNIRWIRVILVRAPQPAQGFAAKLTNLGLAPSVIGSDFAQLGANYGRTMVGNFIEQEMPFVPQNAAVVTIFAGGNEVNTITAALGGGAGGSDPLGFIDNQVKAFGVDYTTLIAGIRARAGQPRIVILNVPNLAGLPFLAGASLAQKQAAQRAAVGMTRTVVNPLFSDSIAIVDLMCDSRSYQSSIYSSDGFHPNDAGHAFLASEIVKAITQSTYPRPQSACAAMTLVP